MADQGQAARRGVRQVDGDVDVPDRAGNQAFCGMHVHGKAMGWRVQAAGGSTISRATGLPSIRWLWMISSMSSRSTKVYQTASG